MPKQPQNIDWAYVIKEAIRSQLARVHTAAPGVVQSYDRERQAAVVQIVVRGRRIDPRTQERSTYVHRPIVNVPVVLPGTPRDGMTFDLAPGDPVLVIFAERDISQWLSKGLVDVSPVDPRRHDLTDAFCIPGAFPFAGAQRPDNAVAAGALVMYGDDIRLGSADAAAFIALAPLVLAELAKVQSWMQSMKNAFDGHLHTGVTVGAGSTAPVVATAPAVPSFDEPASTKVKSE